MGELEGLSVVIHAESIGWWLGKVSVCYWGMCKEKPRHDGRGFVPPQSINVSLILEALQKYAPTPSGCSVREDQEHLIGIYNDTVGNSR